MLSFSKHFASFRKGICTTAELYAKVCYRREWTPFGRCCNQVKQCMPVIHSCFSSTVASTHSSESSVDQLLRAIRTGSFNDIYPVLPYVPGNIIDINIMNILNCCYQSSDIHKLLKFFIDSKFYISSYMYESIIITAGRIGDSKLVSTVYETGISKNGSTTSLRDALLHAYRVCDAHQKVISYTYQLFSDNIEITSCQYEDILRTLVCHEEYDSLCEHILGKMKNQNKYLSLPILSILLNTLDIRSPKLTVLLINQTRYNNNNPPLLNLILSREMMKFSEKQNPEGMLVIYEEMSRRELSPSVSEQSRLKRAVSSLMKEGFSFDVSNGDDLFCQLWSQSWLELRIPSDETVNLFLDIIKHSNKNHSIQLHELLKYILLHNSISVSLSTWKTLLDMKIRLTSIQMLDIVQSIDDSSNPNNIQGILVYAEEVYLPKKHRSRHQIQQVSQDMTIVKRVNELKQKYHFSGTFKKLVDTLQFMEKCLESDVFLYMACGMMVSNPSEGLKLFDEMVKQGKVAPTKQLLESMEHILEEKGVEKKWNDESKSFM